MLSFILVIVCGRFERKRICAAFLWSVYICIAVENQLLRFGFPLTDLTHHILVFPAPYDMAVFVFSEFSYEE